MSIKYELAKKLKDAGFPQIMHSGKLPQFYNEEKVLGFTTFNFNGQNDQEAIYVPTLSELIEACGDRFLALKRLNAFDTTWEAVGPIKSFLEPTPEEAVANLWLELNSTCEHKSWVQRVDGYKQCSDCPKAFL